MEKNKIMMIVIIALLLILIGTIVGVSIYALNIVRSVDSEVETAQQPLNEFTNLSYQEKTRIPEGNPITLGTNLASSNNDYSVHAAKIEFQVYVNNNINNKDKNKIKESTDLITAISGDIYITKSIALSVLRNMTYAEATRPDAQHILADRILSRLQEEYNTNLIVEVVISDLVTQ